LLTGCTSFLQFFIGIDGFATECPFKPTVLVNIRKRLDADFISRINDIYLQKAEPTSAHLLESAAPKAEAPVNENGSDAASDGTVMEVMGTAIIDATCSPSNIRYPQDYSLLNEAREKLEEMIDFFHSQYAPWKKPRTYRRIARKEYLELAKSKKRSAKKIRSVIRKQLGYVRRDLGYLEAYMSEGYALDKKFINNYLVILQLYEQQKYMFDNKTHRVENRIVSIHQPYIRPIVRGKVKTPVEFGAKYDVSIDEKGHARLEKISFDPYNENFCKDHGIRISGPKLGRPSKDISKNKEAAKTEYKDNKDRIEVERFFGLEKGSNGAGLIMTKLKETTLSSIAMSVFVTNLFSTATTTSAPFFILYFADGAFGDCNDQFIVIEDTT